MLVLQPDHEPPIRVAEVLTVLELHGQTSNSLYRYSERKTSTNVVIRNCQRHTVNCKRMAAASRPAAGG